VEKKEMKKEYPNYPGWEYLSCGCCGGIQWGGDYPRECTCCGGSGMIAIHKPTGTIADYPGGPFRGKLAKGERYGLDNGREG
jgi:hypothetical protein